MFREWGGGNTIGHSYKIDKSRLGQIPQKIKDKLFEGQEALCIQHSGDYFFYYVPLFRKDGKVFVDTSLEFGSYCFSEKVDEFNTKDVRYLLADQKIPEYYLEAD